MYRVCRPPPTPRRATPLSPTVTFKKCFAVSSYNKQDYRFCKPAIRGKEINAAVFAPNCPTQRFSCFIFLLLDLDFCYCRELSDLYVCIVFVPGLLWKINEASV